MHPDGSQPPESASPDRQPRLRRLIRAQLTNSRGVTQDVVVRNVSAQGLGAGGKGDPLVRGERVTIDLPRLGMVAGTVRWASGHNFGIELDGSLDVEALGDAVRTLNEPPSQGGWEMKRMHRVVTPAVDPAKLRRI